MLLNIVRGNPDHQQLLQMLLSGCGNPNVNSMKTPLPLGESVLLLIYGS